MTAEQAIAWLEHQANGVALIHNDANLWAVASTGMQNVCEEMSEGSPFDLHTAYFIEKDRFRPTIIEAIGAAIDSGDFGE